MDEGTLNDLLECSVCFERLDTSSKVLPCQHTFCRKCLQEIYQKHKELRCPECRVLVTIKIENLPPNVLLMRILEGMKNSGVLAPPKRSQRPTKGASQHQPGAVSHSAHIQQQNVDRSNNKHSASHAVPHQPYAKALYDYVPKEPGDLQFKKGDIIILKRKIDSHWYQGECGGKQGVFPVTYVQIITPVPSHIPQCKALYDFRMTNDEEEGCLAFNKGDVINVIRRVDENWAEGKLDGRIGIFPLSFVEMNSLARSLMKLSTNVQPGPSKVAPPTPTTEESIPLIPTDHSTSVTSVAQNISHQGPISASDSSSNNITSSSSSTTPNVSSSNTSSSSSTAPSSPASPPARVERSAVSPRNNSRKPEISKNVPPLLPQQSSVVNSPHTRTIEGRLTHHHHHHHGKEKRHSLTNMTVPHHTSAHRYSAEIAESTTGSHVSSSGASERSKRTVPAVPAADPQLPATFMALYPYKPQKSDELELKKGSFYLVTEICQDGWYKGTSNRTQKCGVFPGNYVTVLRGSAGEFSAGFPEGRMPVSFTKGTKGARNRPADSAPPELPPRSSTPPTNVWHVDSPRTNNATNSQPKSDKNKERKEKSTVSLMRRLASIKRSKSPPTSSYSMDNPVFEDATLSAAGLTTPVHPVHVRSGSCPSQLLQVQPSVDFHRFFGSASHRVKHKERPSILNHSTRSTETPQGGSSGSSPDVHRHRKSHSLDATGLKTSRTGSTQTVRERFRCITPYPPNSDYELELQLNDIIYVHKKREDGWFKGTQQRTGKTGLFPASFVESF
ncbi:E3 ubiquitin-protein ligase SH3RF1 isoform X1 [Dendroctonus ponderosae]|uniref:E3 ubiquitin-protein ligase SH3RF1 isoform X1 n=1 Tax=Dendroctonus ponderosae TaxID=77166 RepID=UPI0020355C98|nr:E3 ubiquitin-protein ligase SH3RF1 isoform X1 [Dendroctonus ponderosae]XP_048516464.1 E3 ubiquitin-protein ligase SH3RF1 isoform X1 [Dendroctonus ponderosae]